MTWQWHLLLALFALYMLVRYGPRALRLRGPREERSGAVVAALNVALAVAILVVAVKGIAEWLGSR